MDLGPLQLGDGFGDKAYPLLPFDRLPRDPYDQGLRGAAGFTPLLSSKDVSRVWAVYPPQ